MTCRIPHVVPPASPKAEDDDASQFSVEISMDSFHVYQQMRTRGIDCLNILFHGTWQRIYTLLFLSSGHVLVPARGRVYTKSLDVQQLQHYFSRCVLQTYESTLTSMRCARKKNISHECVAQTHVRREATFIYKLVKVHTASSLGTKNNEYKPKITRRSSSRDDSCDHGARVHRRDCHKCCIMRPRFTRAMERTATRTAHHHLHLLYFLQSCSIRVGVSGHFLQ